MTHSSVLALWVVLSTPACALYAAAAANRAPIEAPPVSAVQTLLFAVAAGAASMAAPSAAGAFVALMLMSALVYLSIFDLRALAVPVWPIVTFACIGLAAAATRSVFTEHAIATAASIGALCGVDAVYRRVPEMSDTHSFERKKRGLAPR